MAQLAAMTLEQVQARQPKAVAFATNVLKDPDLADRLEVEDPADYASRKHLTISNSGRRQAGMANGNGGDDYGFAAWTKTDCVDVLTQVAQLAEDGFDPLASREDMAQSLSDILDALSGGDGDLDGDDVDDDGDDGASAV